MNQEDYQYLLKFVLIGDTEVGKSCFLSQYVKGKFISEYEPTIGLEFESKSIELNDGIVVQNQLWDTSGSGQFKAIQKTFCQNATAAILFYKINSLESFKSLSSWVDILRQVSSEMIQIVIVGTHQDLEDQRQVQITEARKLADDLNAKFYEISNQDKDQIDGIINSLSYNVLRLINSSKINPTKPQYGVKMSRQQEQAYSSAQATQEETQSSPKRRSSDIKNEQGSGSRAQASPKQTIQTSSFSATYQQPIIETQSKQSSNIWLYILPIILAIGLLYFFK